MGRFNPIRGPLLRVTGLVDELSPTSLDKVLAISFVVMCVVYNYIVYNIPNMAGIGFLDTEKEGNK